ncbi:AGAP013252-PA-like protein [Anopheles sinensis]|uniref:AGAP013252-PA-like protein n=1 Tax=Anopheles sinensis TaxID=74873 RepID=A0A084W383_ANOSI|nr:AGAP013252-PA-like protein [Anopheles sinensis]
MFCAGGVNNVSACNGDSGGGIAIVSSIPKTEVGAQTVCDSSKYTVFTDASKYREWILRHTSTRKWLKEPKPHQDRVVVEATVEELDLKNSQHIEAKSILNTRTSTPTRRRFTGLYLTTEAPEPTKPILKRRPRLSFSRRMTTTTEDDKQLK